MAQPIREQDVCERVLVALYLRGGPHRPPLSRKNWPGVLSTTLRANPCWEDVPEVLRRAAMPLEALVLESPGIAEWSLETVRSGACLTAASAGYPQRWIKCLQIGAPPALWRAGPGLEDPIGPCLSIVGSREVSTQISDFAFGVGFEAVQLGRTVVSGNAIGCDSAGMRGALAAKGRVVAILPHGIELIKRRNRKVMYLSVCPPFEEFSRANAMERNALIYAASSETVVVQARLRTGGTWHGAVEAHRRRLSRLLVRQDETESGLRALIALGGTPLGSPKELANAITLASNSRGLFD